MKKSSCCLPERGEPASTCCGGGANAAGVVVASAPTFSSVGMVRLDGGAFLMGGVGPETWPADGEGPVRETVVRPFWIDETAVTIDAFAAFITATGYVTEADGFGWSYIHYSLLSKGKRNELETQRVRGLEWWYGVKGANWEYPMGRPRDFRKLRLGDHPVTHVTWNDAAAYARWAGKRLPTEAEWEYACRGGLEQQLYPWGNELQPGKHHRCNIWQGKFPTLNTGEDGHLATAPARSFKPNGFGLYNTVGNVWEWTADWFDPAYPKTAPRVDPTGPTHGTVRTMRGGSYLCHVSYCNRYRCSARTAVTPDTSSGHLGFRCVADV